MWLRVDRYVSTNIPKKTASLPTDIFYISPVEASCPVCYFIAVTVPDVTGVSFAATRCQLLHIATVPMFIHNYVGILRLPYP
jgi:hypothetical protein